MSYIGAMWNKLCHAMSLAWEALENKYYSEDTNFSGHVVVPSILITIIGTIWISIEDNILSAIFF